MDRRELKAERRRHEILKSAARAFKKKGFYATTMEDIASELLMTQGSLYYYFKSKEEILFACHLTSMEHILSDLARVRSVSAPAAAKLRALVELHVAVMVDDLQASAMALEFTALSEPYLSQLIELRDRFEGGVRAIVREGVEAGEFAASEPRVVAFALLGAINWMARWFDPEGLFTAEQIAAQWADLFLRGLGVDPGSVHRITGLAAGAPPSPTTQ